MSVRMSVRSGACLPLHFPIPSGRVDKDGPSVYAFADQRVAKKALEAEAGDAYFRHECLERPLGVAYWPQGNQYFVTSGDAYTAIPAAIAPRFQDGNLTFVVLTGKELVAHTRRR